MGRRCCLRKIQSCSLAPKPPVGQLASRWPAARPTCNSSSILIGDSGRVSASLASLAPRSATPRMWYCHLVACSRDLATKEPSGIAFGLLTEALLRSLDVTAIQSRAASRVTYGSLARTVRKQILDLSNRPPLVHVAMQGRAPPLHLPQLNSRYSASSTMEKGLSQEGTLLRCDRCGRMEGLGSLYCCEHCGELYCRLCAQRFERRRSHGKRCTRCGGRLL